MTKVLANLCVILTDVLTPRRPHQHQPYCHSEYRPEHNLRLTQVHNSSDKLMTVLQVVSQIVLIQKPYKSLTKSAGITNFGGNNGRNFLYTHLNCDCWKGAHAVHTLPRSIAFLSVFSKL